MVVRASRFSFSYSISQSSGAVSKIETPTSRAAVFVERMFVGGKPGPGAPPPQLQREKDTKLAKFSGRSICMLVVY